MVACRGSSEGADVPVCTRHPLSEDVRELQSNNASRFAGFLKVALYVREYSRCSSRHIPIDLRYRALAGARTGDGGYRWSKSLFPGPARFSDFWREGERSCPRSGTTRLLRVSLGMSSSFCSTSELVD